MNPTTELCFCPVGDVGLQVHFPHCGDPGWDELHDVEETASHRSRADRASRLTPTTHHRIARPTIHRERDVMSTEAEGTMWWRDVSTWRDRLRGERQRRGVVIVEAEPGLVHVTTEALEDLLELAGFKRDAS